MASVGLLTKTAAKTVYGVHVRPYVLSPLRVYHQRLRWLGVTTDAPNILPNDGVFGQSYRHHVHRALPPSSAPSSSAAAPAAAPAAASAPPSTLVSLLLAIGLSGCGGGGGSDPKSGDSAGVSDETGIPALGTVGANDLVDAAMPERSSVVQERATTPILPGEKTGEDQTGDDGDPDHDLLTSVTIASPVHRVFNQSFYQIELHFHQQDDQRSSFDILRQESNDYERGNLETFYQIMGDSFALINEWEDLGLGANLPPSDQLPPII